MAVSKAEPVKVDVLVVGAGISGIDAAYRLLERCPDKSWLILEARSRIGGTWDLFRYPGVRSDSDMFTLGFPFRPWRSDQAIVGGDAIRDYVEETAREFDIFDKIRFGHRVTQASWSSADSRWTVETDHGRFTCTFLYLGTGYYDYAQGYRPEWPGEAEFGGRIVHPQFWPDNLDVSGMKVAIIGSGATAVTLAPALAEQGGKVTIVQRSPTYVVARPGRSVVARLLQEALPARAAGATIRWLNILLTIFMYGRARRKPDRVAKWIRDQARAQLPEGYPVDRDFTPDYKPWDQRLCLIPDGDLFAAMSADKVSIATGAIERFTPKGLRLVTAEEVEADIIVTATGLNVRFLGGIEVEIDGKRLSAPECLVYRGMMLSGVPNLFVAFGYTNASWTLRVDLTARSVCRLLNHMRRNGQDVCVPRQEGSIEPRPILELSSGYLTRALPTLPSQGDRQPWRVPQNYLRDLAAMSLGRIDQELELRSSGG